MAGGRRAAGDDGSLRAAEQPRHRQDRQGDEPRQDPGRRGKACARQSDERASDERPGGAARDAACESGDAGRCPVLEQMRRDGCTGRHECALRERRQAGDACHEPEPDRCARKVEPAGQVGEARIAGEGRDERRGEERQGRQRRPERPVAPRVAQTFAERGEAAHSTASDARKRQASTASPSVSGITSRSAGPPPQCAEVTVDWIRPSAIPARSAWRASNQAATAATSP